MKSHKQIMAVKKARVEPGKIKSTNKMIILRMVLWSMLVFIFIKGVFSCLHQDKESEIRALISEFKTQFNQSKDTSYEALGFAQNFVQEYLTYDEDGADAFLGRIEPYVSSKIKRTEGIYDFKSSSEAIYTEAYRMEAISSTQVDVYVKAKVKYTIQETQEDEGIRNFIKLKDVVLKVPIHISSSEYIVEDLPVFINDYTLLDTNYENISYAGEEIDSEPYEECVENFLQAYYGAEQNVLDYFLSTDAAEVVCLGSSFEFTKLVSLQTYRVNDSVLCICNYKITDNTNGVILMQDVNMSIVSNDGRQYIKSMETRTTNLEEE